MIILDFLWNVDLAVLRYLNIELQYPWLDLFWKNLTQLHKIIWFQAGVFPIVLLLGVYIYRWHFLKVLLGVGLAVALSDLIAYRLVKSNVNRPRPFQNAEVSSWVRQVGHAHGSSFPSNHAANVFAGASVLSWYFRRRRHFFYAFAALVAISRPALGVHYPSDVLAGSLLGFLLGQAVVVLILKRSRRLGSLGSAPNWDANLGDWRKRFERES